MGFDVSGFRCTTCKKLLGRGRGHDPHFRKIHGLAYCKKCAVAHIAVLQRKGQKGALSFSRMPSGIVVVPPPRS